MNPIERAELEAQVTGALAHTEEIIVADAPEALRAVLRTAFAENTPAAWEACWHACGAHRSAYEEVASVGSLTRLAIAMTRAAYLREMFR